MEIIECYFILDTDTDKFHFFLFFALNDYQYKNKNTI